MSELTQCNFCSLRSMKQRAKERGVTVIMGKDEGWITARYSDEAEPSRWFLQLTDHCVC